MSPPPTNIDGTDITAATIDGTEVQEITIDGETVFTAAPELPGTAMFQSPIYQYTAVAGLNLIDGQTASNWTEQLAGAGDATNVGSPVYRSNQSGFEAVEYDGVDDGHNFPSDGQLPTGGNPVSVAATIFIKNNKRYNCVFSYGNTGDAGSVYLLIDSGGEVRADITGQGTDEGGSLPSGEWVTAGAVFNSTDIFGYANGNRVVSDFPENPFNQTDENRGLAYAAPKSAQHSDIYIFDLIVSSATESDQAFSDYHTDRIG